MATEAEIIEEKNFVTDKISEQCRLMAAGLLAFNWLFLTGGEEAPVLPASASSGWLLASILFACGALVLDYVQYRKKLIVMKRTLKLAEVSPTKEALYDYGSADYRAMDLAFSTKQYAVLISAAFLMVYVGIRFWPSSDVPAEPPPSTGISQAR